MLLPRDREFVEAFAIAPKRSAPVHVVLELSFMSLQQGRMVFDVLALVADRETDRQRQTLAEIVKQSIKRVLHFHGLEYGRDEEQ